MTEIVRTRQPRAAGDTMVDLLIGALHEFDRIEQQVAPAPEEVPVSDAATPDRRKRRLVPDTSSIISSRVGKITLGMSAAGSALPEVYDETAVWSKEVKNDRFELAEAKPFCSSNPDEIEWPKEEPRAPFHPTGHPTTDTARLEPVPNPADAPTEHLKPVPPPGTVNP